MLNYLYAESFTFFQATHPYKVPAVVELLWQRDVPGDINFAEWLQHRSSLQLGPKGILYPGKLYELWTLTKAGISRFDYRPILKARLDRDNIAVRHVTFIWLGDDAAFVGQYFIYVLAPPYTAVTRKIPIQTPISWNYVTGDLRVPREPHTGTLYSAGVWDIGFGAYGGKAFTQLHVNEDQSLAFWSHNSSDELWHPTSIEPRGGMGRKIFTSFAFQEKGFGYTYIWSRKFSIEAHDGSTLKNIEAYNHEDNHVLINSRELLISSEKFLKGKRKTRTQWIYNIDTSETLLPILPKVYKSDVILGHAGDIWYLLDRSAKTHSVKAITGVELEPIERISPKYLHENATRPK
ncbi:MAG: hypothetical protein ACPGVT_11315 [Maricaulaceae bacterium]